MSTTTKPNLCSTTDFDPPGATRSEAGHEEYVEHQETFGKELIDLVLATNRDCPEMRQLVLREGSFTAFGAAHMQADQFDREISAALAKAGFYRTGEGYRVRCFWCGHEFHNWDPGDDPWVLHTRASPKCPWVLLCRGRDGVVKVLKQALALPETDLDVTDVLLCWSDAHATGSSSRVGRQLTDKELEDRMALEKYREAVVDLKLLSYSIECYSRKTGDDPPSIQTLLETVWGHEKRMQELGFANASEYTAHCRLHLVDQPPLSASSLAQLRQALHRPL